MESLFRMHVAMTVLVVGLPLFVAGGVVADGAVDGTLTGDAPVTLDGSTTVTSDTAFVRTLSSTDAQLEADRVEVRIAWETGHKTADLEESDSSYRRLEATGVDWHNFTSTNTEFSVLDENPQLLSFPTNDTGSRTEASGPVEAHATENQALAKHGARADVGHNDSVGFYHLLEDPHVALTGADSARVSGNFTLFVNNVTIDVTDSDQGQWTNWTGYRETSPDSPAGPLENPAAKEYEVRATTLHVTNGTLWLNATDAVDLYAEDANAIVNGSISAPSVSGELLSHPLRYEYDEDPLRLFGKGSLDVGLASEDSARTPARAPGTATAPLPLELTPSGGFDVQKTTGVEVSQAETTSAWNPVSWFDGGSWLALAFLATAIAGVAVGATVPERAHSALGAVVEGWRERQYKRWGREAKMAIEDNDYGRAEKLAARATRLIPDAQGAWMTLAIAQFASETPERALTTLREAQDEVDRLPKEFLDLWITYALDLGESEEAIQAWFQLAKTAPQRALMMYADEEYEVFQDNPRVQDKVEEIKTDLLAENPEMAGLLESIGDRSRGDGGDDGHGPEVA